MSFLTRSLDVATGATCYTRPLVFPCYIEEEAESSNSSSRLGGWEVGRLGGCAAGLGNRGQTRKIFVLSGGIMEHLCRKLEKFCGLVPYPRSMISKINNVDPWIQY